MVDAAWYVSLVDGFPNQVEVGEGVAGEGSDFFLDRFADDEICHGGEVGVGSCVAGV